MAVPTFRPTVDTIDISTRMAWVESPDYVISTKRLVSFNDIDALIIKVDGIIKSKLPDSEIKEKMLEIFKELPADGRIFRLLSKFIPTWSDCKIFPTVKILETLKTLEDKALAAWN